MMKEEKKLLRPSVEKLNEYDELYKKLSDQQLTDKQREELMGQLNDIIGEYDLSNYTFNDPTTGKIGVKNPAGLVRFQPSTMNSASSATTTFSKCRIWLLRKTANGVS